MTQHSQADEMIVRPTLLEKTSLSVELASKVLVGGLVLAMLVVTGAQITSRYVFDSSFFWSEELVRYLFVWTAFIGGSIALRRGAHLSIDVFGTMARQKGGVLSYCVLALTFFAMLATLVFACWYGMALAIGNMSQTSITLGIPMFYPYLAVPVATALMLIHHIADAPRWFAVSQPGGSPEPVAQKNVT